MRRTVLVLLLLGTVLAGCGGVPTSGDVRTGNEEPVPANQPSGVVQYKPLGPRERADRESIVDGFLEAMADPANADVARQYLTKDAAAKWRPNVRTTVYDSSAQGGSPREAPDGTVVLEGKWVSTLDGRGSWQPPGPGGILKHAFVLETEGGEWRITNPLEGTMIDQDRLTLVYAQYNLYFFNGNMDQLVPDPVYLPRTGTPGQVATRLTDALLKGPTSRLGPQVVRTAAPPNAKVNVSVPVEAGVASVALDDTVARLGTSEKAQLAAQITWTLGPVAAEVKLTAADVPLVEDGSETRTVGDFPQYDPMVRTMQLYVVDNGKIARINQSDGQASVEPVRTNLTGYTTEEIAVDLGTKPTFAVVGNNDVTIGELVVPDETPSQTDEPPAFPLDTTGKPLRPSFDKAGNLWVVDRAGQLGPRIQFITPNQAPPGQEPKRETYEVGAPELADKQVTAIRVAPDGARVLLVTRSGNKSSVYIAGAVHTDDVISLRLGRPVPVPMRTIVDVGWSAADRFMVLGNNGSGSNQIREVSVDGSTDPLQGLSPTSYNPIYLAAAPSTDALLTVGDQAGWVRIRGSDNSWRDSLMLDRRNQSDKLHHPVYPG